MIGFIGTGNMGGAILNGIISSQTNRNSLFAFNTNKAKLETFKDKGVTLCDSSKELVKNAKYIILAVKPNIYPLVLDEIKDSLTNDHVLITVAAGFDINKVKSFIGANKKVVRTMPNTPALIGQGFTVICFDEIINKEESETVLSIMSTLGKTIVTSEKNINIYSALTGSGPAFTAIYIEALADAAVLLGIPRGEAYTAAATMISGTSELYLSTKRHPGDLKDMVCSPGGTSIEGVRTLEEKGFRSAVIEAIINTYKKNLDLDKIRWEYYDS